VWEYMVLRDHAVLLAEHKADLDELGRDAWEAVGMAPAVLSDSGSSWHGDTEIELVILFKRPSEASGGRGQAGSPAAPPARP
jgi:hypothetical protein